MKSLDKIITSKGNISIKAYKAYAKYQMSRFESYKGKLDKVSIYNNSIHVSFIYDIKDLTVNHIRVPTGLSYDLNSLSVIYIATLNRIKVSIIVPKQLLISEDLQINFINNNPL